ncbi:PREDICTED: uncharacterized protein LOC108547716 isoform X2 [Eufriesea mexicana]|uniref:uncharacterized protein LOC108547716 isoform X1 n=1 Tax=Eufriesea mexicana TaxID=516756 RepID=UPI00083BB5E4|nr:PREDICTED: uncharacterized protein LOC108547716 isoform X1 [Eufriesea mexicana]XP_017755833.1 PREDICTED: uncharacterized protein LOC108547716 isoform X2 [Eufriesea mexicana]
MFSRLLLLLAVIGFAAATIPSYIHVCGRRNPHFDECVNNSMTALRGNLRNGMPELDIPSIEPLKINEMKIIDEPQIKITAKDIKLNGLWTFHLNFLHLDLEKKELTADFAFDKITLDADFLLKLNILVPIQRKGVMVLKCNNAGAKIKAYYKLIKRDNEQYVHFESIPIKLDIKDYTADFKTENLDSSLQSAINDVLGKNHDDVLRTIQPHVEKAISKSCINLTNKIYDNFTYDELFPDRA